MSNHRRGNQGESLVAKVLEALPGLHYVENDVTLLSLTGMSHQIDHVLFHPHGIFVIETKNYRGEMLFEEESGRFYRLDHGQKELLASPLLQNKTHIRHLRRAVGKEYDVVPVVVFAQNNAPYAGDENVISLQDLPLFLDCYPYARILTEKELSLAHERLLQAKREVSSEEHLENIGYLKQAQREEKEEIRLILEEGVCPACDRPIQKIEGRYVCPRCGYKRKI